MSRPRVRDLVRFARQYVVDAESGCWLWQGYLGVGGYGMFALARPKPLRHRTVPAHRASYLLHVGAIPKGMDLDHLCRVRHCVNPAHLEPVTERENAMRGDTLAAANAAKTHCPAGHPYDEENTAGRARGDRPQAAGALSWCCTARRRP